MLRKTDNILPCIICMILLFACNTAKIPSEYMQSRGKVEKTSTGCWIEIKAFQPGVPKPAVTTAGELIAVHSDTLFVLTAAGLDTISAPVIQEAKLYIYKNQSGLLVLGTVVAATPSLIGAIVNDEPGFLVLTVPVTIVGGIISSYENSSGGHTLKFPAKNTLIEFNKFSRFPQGMPDDLIPENLRLIKSGQQ